MKSINIVKGMSGEVGKFADTIGKSAAGLALGAATGGSALLARGTLGKAAGSLASSRFGTRLEGLANSDNKFYRGIGKLGTGAINKTASSTFDVRNTKTFGSTVGQLKGLTGDLISDKALEASGIYGKGKDQKTGYIGAVDRDKKAAEKEGEAVGKRAEAYQQQFVDQEITDQLRKKRDDLEKELDKETDPKKKEDKRKELNEIKGQISKTSKEGADALQKIKEGVKKEDFEAADSKINEAKRKVIKAEEENDKLDAEIEKIEEAIRFDGEGEVGKTPDAIKNRAKLKKLKERMESINAEIKEKQKDVATEEENKKELEKQNAEYAKQREKLGDKLNEVLDAKNRRADFAKAIRSRLTGYEGDNRELNEISEAAEGKYVPKSDKEKNKERETKSKESKELAKEIAKANAAEAKDNK